MSRREPTAQRRPAPRVRLHRDDDDDREGERDERELRRLVVEPVEEARAAIGDLPGLVAAT
jgi:hypothetical protein